MYLHTSEFVSFKICPIFNTLYLHSLHPLHSLRGFNWLCWSPPPYFTYIHCVHCIHCIHCVHCMGSTHCVDPHHHLVLLFPASTAFTAWVKLLVPTTTFYLHSLYSQCGFNSLYGSPPPSCTYTVSTASTKSTVSIAFTVWVQLTVLVQKFVEKFISFDLVGHMWKSI